nr:hypothetical protein [Solirubrobacterales bacterium]
MTERKIGKLLVANRGEIVSGVEEVVAVVGTHERRVTPPREAPLRPPDALASLARWRSEGAGGKARSCRGVEILAPLGEIDYRNVRTVLA